MTVVGRLPLPGEFLFRISPQLVLLTYTCLPRVGQSQSLALLQTGNTGQLLP